jgi:uncharacterized protein GlcG (DUF336 family)
MYLTEDELILILIQALVKARKLRSGLAENDRPKIHVAIQGVRRQKEPVVVYSDEDAKEEMRKLSQLKSSVSVKHSSDDLAMSSHAVGHLMAQKKGMTPTFSHAGGVPLYKQGKLVGSIGISGDTPEVDEAIAHAAAESFSAPLSIRSDRVANVPFHSGKIVLEREKEAANFLPTLDNRTSSFPTRKGTRNTRGSSPSIGALPAFSPLPSLSASAAALPPLPSAPSTPTMLPRLPSTPLAPSTPSMLPKLSSTPLAPSTPSMLPPLSLSPSATMRALSLPVNRSQPPSPRGSPLPSLRSSPLVSLVENCPASIVTHMPNSLPASPIASPLPPLRAGSSLSSLAPTGFDPTRSPGPLRLPVLPPSPQFVRTNVTLPTLSRLTPLK